MIAHIGYPKTASSYLQEAIFPNIKNLNYLHQKDTLEFLDIIFVNSLSFNPKNYTKKLDQKPNTLISLESLVGHTATGVHSKEIAYRLKDLGFKKIILTIRNQKNLLDSLYREHIHQGGTISTRDFFDERYRMFRYEFADFKALADHYQTVFGKENILICIQEELRKSPHRFLEKLINFLPEGCALPENLKSKSIHASMSNAGIKLLRFTNIFTHSFNNPHPFPFYSRRFSTKLMKILIERTFEKLIFQKKKKSLVPQEILDRAKSRYSESNKTLNEAYSLELEKYNYWI